MELAERWLPLAGQALVGTGIDGASIERLAAWSADWPSHDRVAWVLALLGRCSGLATLLEVRRALGT